jgi:hypothetical protein
MKFLRLTLCAYLLTCSSTAYAQIVTDETTNRAGGNFGETSHSIEFSDIKMDVTRVVREGATGNNIRVVLKLENQGNEEQWAQLVLRDPYMVDQMGNTYRLSGYTGIGVCTVNSNWTSNLEGCHRDKRAAKLASGVPTIVSFSFAPGEDEYYFFNESLASIATYVELKVRFAISPGPFTSNNRRDVLGYSLAVYEIPLPRN